jgi:hypothetical protein
VSDRRILASAGAQRFIEEFGAGYPKAEPLWAGAKLTVTKVVLGTDDLDNVRVWVHLEDEAGNSYELLTDAVVFDPEYEQADDLAEGMSAQLDITEAQAEERLRRAALL